LASRDKVNPIDSSKTVFESIVSGRRWHVYFPRRIIWQRWEEIVGKPVASSAYPWHFKELHCLVIAVSDSIWMQQLSYESVSLLEKINSLLPGHARLSHLRFVVTDVDSVKRNTKWLAANRRMKRKNRYAKGVTARDLNEKELGLLESLDDPELRQHFENILRHLDS